MILLLAVLSVLQPSLNRFKAAVLFSGITATHCVFLGDTGGMLYYLSAAYFDLATIAIISIVDDSFVLKLQRVCIFSIVVNLIGWVLWFFYQPPTYYNSLFYVVYAGSVIVLMTRENVGVGDSSLNGGGCSNHRDWCTRVFNLSK